MTLTLEDIERRAKARGWHTKRGHYAVEVYDDSLARVGWWCESGGRVWLRQSSCPTSIIDYLEGETEALAAREGAARVLSVVSQVAAMAWTKRELEAAWEAESRERARENDEAHGWDFGGA